MTTKAFITPYASAMLDYVTRIDLFLFDDMLMTAITVFKVCELVMKILGLIYVML